MGSVTIPPPHLFGVRFFPRCRHLNLIPPSYFPALKSAEQKLQHQRSLWIQVFSVFSLSDSLYPAGGLLANGVFAGGLSDIGVWHFFSPFCLQMLLLCFIPLSPLRDVEGIYYIFDPREPSAISFHILVCRGRGLFSAWGCFSRYK